MDGNPAEARVGGTTELIDLIHAFSAALESHYDWLWQVQRAVVCGRPDDVRDQECGLMHWLAEPAHGAALEARVDATELLRAHATMHATAHALLQQAREAPSANAIPPGAYDRFLDHRKAFKTAALAVERALWNHTCLIDALTGLRNRHGMMMELREEQQRAKRDRQACVLAMMDIDHFKRINDNHGHAAGDTILREVTRTASRRLRPYDRIYRYGGEEFLICLPQIDLLRGHGIIERLREEIAATPVHIATGDVKVTASFGMATVDTETPVEESIHRADQALYAAKSNGRNKVIAS